MVLNTSLLNTQHYKIWIKGKLYPSLHIDLVAIERGAFRLPSTTVSQLDAYVLNPKLTLSHRLGPGVSHLAKGYNGCYLHNAKLF